MKPKYRGLVLCLLFVLLLAACGGAAEEAASEPGAASEATAVPPSTAADEPKTVAEVPTATAEPEPTAASKPEAEAEPTAEPQVEPAAASLADYVDIDVEPGVYLYTSGNFIQDMVLYDGRVWVASLGGVLAWDVASGTAQKYTTFDGLPHIGIYGITACPVPEMTLLAGTEDGLAAYDPDSDSWYLADDIFKTEVVHGLMGVSGAKVEKLLCDEANNRLIMEYKGVTMVDLADRSVTNVPASSLSWSGVRDLAVVGSEIWVSSGFRGYTVIDGNEVRPYSLHAGTFDADTIYHVATAPNGDLWMAASEGLLQVRNNQVVTIFNRDNTQNFSTPYYVAFDPAGAMWLGMTNRVCQFDPASGVCNQNYNANQVDGMPYGTVTRILFDEAGGLYYHVFEDGWSYFDGENWQLFKDDDLPIHAVQRIYDDGQGKIWLLGGTANTLQNDLELSQEWQRFRDMGGEDIVADANGNIWLATGRNLYQYDGFQIVRRTGDDGLLDAYARAVAIDSDGRIWMGQENGVSIWDGQSFTTLSAAAGDWPEGNIQTLLVDGEVVWVGASTGLIRYEAGVAELVLHKDVVNMPSPVVYALAKHPDGRLLVGTGAGLVYYDHANRRLEKETAVPVWVTGLAVSQEGEIFATSAADIGGGLYLLDEDGWLHLSTADGLPTNRMRTVLFDSAGTLWIGGGYWSEGGGLMRFVP